VKVSDLADQLGITVKQAMVLTGKPNQNTVLTEMEVDKAAADYASQETPASRTKAVVRFWSEVMKHSFPVVNPVTGEQQLVYFSDFKLDVEKGSTAYNAVLALCDPNIRIIIDKPFEDVGDAKVFRDLLDRKVFTGPLHEAGAVRGVGFLQALFRNDELTGIAKTMHKHGLGGVIEEAVRRKSYVQATKEVL